MADPVNSFKVREQSSYNVRRQQNAFNSRFAEGLSQRQRAELVQNYDRKNGGNIPFNHLSQSGQNRALVEMARRQPGRYPGLRDDMRGNQLSSQGSQSFNKSITPQKTLDNGSNIPQAGLGGIPSLGHMVPGFSSNQAWGKQGASMSGAPSGGSGASGNSKISDNPPNGSSESFKTNDSPSPEPVIDNKIDNPSQEA